MPYTTIPQVKFGRPWQDMSVSVLKTTEDGSILVGQYDYSSEVVAVWRCSNQASVEFFAHRFVLAIDSWHDAFAVGPVIKTTLTHQPAGGDGGIEKSLTDEVEIGFHGWMVPKSLWDDNDVDKYFDNLDDAIDEVNRPTKR